MVREPNRGLASFNAVLARLDEPVVLLLNNDVKLDPDAVGPLVRAFDEHADALFAAPRAGPSTAATTRGCGRGSGPGSGWSRGSAASRVTRSCVDRPDLTASAGPVLAVDRAKFLALGGYDPIYFPGRIEDLDLGFRGWMAGWRGYYVPESVAYHRGFGSFGPAFGAGGCDRLAARNTLIFAWKNLSGAEARWPPGLAPRPAGLRPRRPPGSASPCALFEALEPAPRGGRGRGGAGGRPGGWIVRQEAFFERFRF